MKKVLALFVLSGIITGCSAGSEPVAGIWKRMPVVGADQRALVRTSFIFTDQALTEKTVFSVLQDNTAGFKVICCIEVTNLKALDVKAIKAKYKSDPDFVAGLDGVKGARFVYEAQPVAKKDWSPEMRTFAAIDANRDDTSYFSAPVISGMLAHRHVANKFEVGGKKVELKNTREVAIDRITYQFTLNGRVIKLSEQEEPAE